MFITLWKSNYLNNSPTYENKKNFVLLSEVFFYAYLS
jgi:hypothetical protein